MKLSAVLIAAVAASPMGNWGGNRSPGSPDSPHSALDTDSRYSPYSGKPHSGKPHSGKPHSGKPHSGKPHSGKPHSGHFDKEMEEEYKEFQDLMFGKGKGGNTNGLNVNFAPVNTNVQNFIDINTEVETDVDVNSGKSGRDGHDRHEKPQSGQGHGRPERPQHEGGKWKEHLMRVIYNKMEEAYPYLPVMKEIIEAVSGMDCDEIRARIEEELFDGEKIEIILMKIEAGLITKTEIQWWMRSKSAELYQKFLEECPWINMTPEEREEAEQAFKEWMKEQFGIDCDRIKEGLKDWIHESFDLKVEELLEKIEQIAANHNHGPQGSPQDYDWAGVMDDLLPNDKPGFMDF